MHMGLSSDGIGIITRHNRARLSVTQVGVESAAQLANCRANARSGAVSNATE